MPETRHADPAPSSAAAASFEGHPAAVGDPAHQPFVDPELPMLVAEALRQAGLPVDAGIPGIDEALQGVGAGEPRLSRDAAQAFLSRALRRLDDDLLGLRLGASVTPERWGERWSALCAAASPRALLEWAAEHAPLAQGLVDLYIEDTPAGLWVTAEPLVEDPRVQWLVAGYALAAMVRIHQAVVDRIGNTVGDAGRSPVGGPRTGPLRAEWMAGYPADLEAWRQAIPGRLVFAQPHDRVLFPALPAVLPHADPARVAAVTRARDAARARLGPVDDLAAQVGRVVRRHGIASITQAQVAALLLVSERTLRRRLLAIGESFAGILDRERRILALRLIRLRKLRLQEVARRCGYRDARSLRRAVSRWTGMSPTALAWKADEDEDEDDDALT